MVQTQKITIQELSPKKINGIIKKWKALGAANQDLANLRQWGELEKCSCMSVSEGRNVLAVFDIRDAIAHIKNMDVIFNPEINLDIDGQTIEQVHEIIDRLIYVLANIFSYVMNLSKKWGVVKIYNDSPFVNTVFTGFANRLKEESPSLEVLLYKRWVEIRNRDTNAEKIREV